MEFTGITKQNRRFFTHLAPVNLLEKAGSFGYYGIGAAEGHRPELKGAGVILFRIRRDAMQECYATVEWIYVREDLRRQGIGSALLSEMESSMEDFGPESLCMDLPTMGHSDIKGLLKKSGCRSAILKVPFYEMPVGAAFKALTELAGTDDHRDLRMLDESDLGSVKRGSKKLINDRYVEDLAFIASQPEAYYEPEVSFVHMDREEVNGWILVHKEGNGIFSIVSFEGTDDCRISDMNRLFSGCVDAMLYKYGKKAVFHIPIRSAEELEHLERFVNTDLQRTVERFVKPFKSE